jgi:hypothetical protein
MAAPVVSLVNKDTVMQHFPDPKNPKNLPIDTTGVRQLDWEQKVAGRYVVPLKREPHDGKTYREKHGDPSPHPAPQSKKKK